MTEELKPCPFCGHTVSLERIPMWQGSHGYRDCYKYDIHCDICDCTVNLGENHTIYISDEVAKSNAIKAWNKRSLGIKDLITGEDTGLTPEDLLKMVQQQLVRLLSQNSQITQEIKNCQGLIEQLRTY